MDKIKVVSIVLIRAEGPIDECGKVTVRTYAEADSCLRRWSRTAPEGGGYDKVDFVVTYADGDVYQGRYDLIRDDDRYGNLISGHMADLLAFYSGTRYPSHMTRERYQEFLSSQWGAGIIATAKDFLERYALAD